ncbi:hypothetical protein ABZ490_39600 [Streptomyces sp. NPDC005811]|uniref:hypothetical protein n=1 Tax=Streptomyces sp. NPDC005811 TaxID=3154565 RepID=UPI00340E5573
MPLIIALENLVLGSAPDLAGVPEGRADRAFEVGPEALLNHARTLLDRPPGGAGHNSRAARTGRSGWAWRPS